VEATGWVVAGTVAALTAWRETDRALSGPADLALLAALADMKGQVGRLVHRGFVSEVGAGRLRELPRYLAAVRVRLEKLPGSPGRDRQLMDQVAGLERAYLDRVAALPQGRVPDEQLVRVRWMLEEYRVSLWAQQLGTAYPVSDTRIRRALESS
jgi:ATP-dependent helicase HrpA